MKLYLKGHDYKYAAEQMLLTLFPGERPSYPDRPAGEGPGRGGRPLGQRGPEARPGAQLPSGRLPWAVVREPRQSRARVSGEGPEIPPCGVRNPALARDSDLPRAGPR